VIDFIEYAFVWFCKLPQNLPHALTS